MFAAIAVSNTSIYDVWKEFKLLQVHVVGKRSSCSELIKTYSTIVNSKALDDIPYMWLTCIIAVW